MTLRSLPFGEVWWGLRFPTFLILSLPHLHRRVITLYMAIFWIAMKRSACTPCNICEMAKQDAFVSFIHRRIEFCIAANTVHKVVEMKKIKVAIRAYGIRSVIICRCFYFFYQLIIVVKYFVIIVPVIHQGSFVTINNKTSSGAFSGVNITNSSFPGDGLSFRKIKTGNLCIGRFPVIFKSIAAAGRIDFDRIVYSKEPAAAIQFMCSIITGFGSTPMPEPMPVVMDEVILVRPSRSGSLPQIKI